MFMNDDFTKEGNNLYAKAAVDLLTGEWKSYMECKANRPIKSGEELCMAYGTEYWRIQCHFKKLSKASQKKCIKYYNFTFDEIEDDDDDMDDTGVDDSEDSSPIRMSARVRKSNKV